MGGWLAGCVPCAHPPARGWLITHLLIVPMTWISKPNLTNSARTRYCNTTFHGTVTRTESKKIATFFQAALQL
jgi:hypothetical protein